MLGLIGDTTYNIVLLLHILSAIVAFAPAFVHPFIANQMRDGGEGRTRLMGFIVQNGRQVYAPALIVTGLLGFFLQGLSDGVWEFSQTWMWGAIVVWIAMNGILHAVIIPTERAMAQGDESTANRLNVAGPAISILLVVMLYLMIWKPGF